MRNGLLFFLLLYVLLSTGVAHAAGTPVHNAAEPTIHRNVIYGMRGGVQLQDESPEFMPGAESRTYKTTKEAQLRLHIFQPPGAAGGTKPAIVFFFGGGWIGGTVTQYVSRCKYLSARGMVAVVADYRVKSRHGVGAFECVSDAKSAIRWLRVHAAESGIDDQRIVAAGGISGGHLAASTALIDDFDEPTEDLSVSSVPNALVLFNPALDLPALFASRNEEEAVAQFGDWVTRCEHISPMTHVRSGAPPTIIFHGTADDAVPIEQARRFAETMRTHDNRCDLVEYPGRPHGFSLPEHGDGSDYRDTLDKTDAFLETLGYLPGKPEVDGPKIHQNVIYGMHGGLALLMDVYEPAESNGHALIFIAGSGWHWPADYGAGGIKDAVATGEKAGGGSHEVFADAGFTVFVINHRQAPLFRYPAAVDDARRAVRYIRHHGHEYRVTKEAVAAFGISSGAHLALMLALGNGEGEPDSQDEVERQSAKVDVVAAFAGPTDLAAMDWGARGTGAVTSFMGSPPWVPGAPHAEASPINYVGRDDPPVLLIHGHADEIVPVTQGRSLAARLREHDVEVEYVEIAGGGHDFDKVLDHDPNELPSFRAMARWLIERLRDAD